MCKSTSKYLVILEGRFPVAGTRMVCLQKRSRGSRNPQKSRKIIFRAQCVKKTSLHCSSLVVSLSFAITGLQREVSSTYLKLPGNSIEMVGFKRGRAGQGLSSAHEFRGIPRHSEAPSRNRRFCWPWPRKHPKGIRNASAGEGKGERQGDKFREDFKANFFEHQRPNSEAFRTPQTAPQGQIGLEFSKYMKSGCSGSKCTGSLAKKLAKH